MSNPGDFWTEARIQRLTELLEAGCSSGAAARVLDCTRNAVIGKAYRLNLNFQSQHQPRPTEAAWLIVQQKRFRAMGWRLDRAMQVLALPKLPGPRNPKLCSDPSCRNTKQPGWDFCASCLTPKRRAA